MGSCGRGTGWAPRVQSRLVGPEAQRGARGRQDRGDVEAVQAQRCGGATRSVTRASAGTWMNVPGAQGMSW